MNKCIGRVFAVVMFLFVLPTPRMHAQTGTSKKPSPDIANFNTSTADQEKPRFEIISIKRVPYDDHMSDCNFRPGGRFTAHAPLALLIAVSYDTDILRVSNIPSFIEKFDWDIEAKPEEGKYPLNNGLLDRHLGNLMIQSMLEDRFKLKTHWETRIMSGYELTIAKGGSKLKEAEIVQSMLKANNGKGGRAMVAHGDGEIGAYNVSVSGLARLIEATLHRTVLDKTGIEGSYDMRITWTPEKGSSIAGSGPKTSADPEMTIFEAIQEQLGLRLAPAKLPTTYLVVDDVQTPTTN
jgi:uncharacterized protein (TIGR03435 family)